VGVDLGASNVRGALFGPAGDRLAHATEPTAAERPASIVAQVGALARRLAADAELDWRGVAAVGVGVPGVVGDGRLRMAPNLPAFGDVDIATVLADELDCDVTVDNDANMAAVGEQRRGRAHGVDDFVFISVGTGVGMGIVAAGRLVRGARGAAGEIGELRAIDGSTLEAFAGGAGVADSAALPTAHDVFAAADGGHAGATAALERQADGVAGAVEIVRQVLDPSLVVLGGGIGSRDDFVDRVRDRVHGLPVEASALGDSAGVVGAAEAARLEAEERVGA
jgi:predicted NBD/HSP70 family sugar kinase